MSTPDDSDEPSERSETTAPQPTKGTSPEAPAPSSPAPSRMAKADGEGRDPFRFLGAGLVLAIVVGAGLWVIKSPVDTRSTLEDASASSQPTGSAEAPPPPPPRCVKTSGQSFRVGQNVLEDEDNEEDDEEQPGAFGAEISRAVALSSGFAVGVRHDTGSGAHAAVALVTNDASSGKLVDFGKARGDFDAPLVVARGEGWLGGVLEPNASGSSLRMAVGQGDGEPKWTVELDQGRDESLAFDVAAGPKAVVVAWDDVSKDGKLARVLWSALDTSGTKKLRDAAVASGKGIDAETPRVVARPGGFWLAYVARRSLDVPKDDDDDALARDPKGDRYAAEKIDPSWLELMPLDETGAPAGPPRAITPKTGHALAFDLATTADGAALLVWRDDDTPSGSHGGRVSVMTVAASGGTDAHLLIENDVGSGSPTLLAGWVAVANAHGRAMLAPVGPNGALTGELRVEPAIGVGEPLVAVGERVLTATSVGTAIDLAVVVCKP
jgi:hypothetical protein